MDTIDQNIKDQPEDNKGSQNHIAVQDTQEELITAIQNAKTKQELEPLYQQFNINNTKKEAARVYQLNDLLDKVNQQAIERFTRRPNEISNKEVIDYMNAIQNQIERSQKVVDGVKDLTAVQVNNTQNNTITVNMGDDKIGLSKDSRNKIADVISEILKENTINKSNENIIDITEPDKQPTEDIKLDVLDDDSFEGDN